VVALGILLFAVRDCESCQQTGFTVCSESRPSQKVMQHTVAGLRTSEETNIDDVAIMVRMVDLQ
jgi:hypothetical protein